MSLDSSPQVDRIVQAKNEVNCTWVLRYHKCFQLWITVKWPRSYIFNINPVSFLNVVGTSEILYLKIKGKTLRKKIKKSVQRMLGLHFIHEEFFKSLHVGYISSQNVSYSKSMKLNTFSLLELFVVFSQFLSGAT